MQTIQQYFLWLILIILINSFLLAQKITKTPYILEPNEIEMTIRWETDANVNTVLHYREKKALWQTAKAELRGIKEDGYLYEAQLKGLSPGCEYSYQILINGSAKELYQFKTSMFNVDNFKFVAMGDSRSYPEIFQTIVDYIKSEEPNFIISMGDLVENGGDYDQWGKYYFSVAKDIISQIPIVSTLGDHEGDEDDGELFRHFLREDQPNNKQWFSFDYGSTHFISLDYRYPYNEEMIEWFKKDISQSDARWKIVYTHNPVYNIGAYCSMWGRNVWPELFRKYQVDIVFAGHSHIYERFYPMRPEKEPNSWPVTYITTGGAGAELYDVSKSDYLAVAESVHHHIIIEISGDTLDAKAYRNDYSLLDEFRIIKNNKYFDEKYLSKVMAQEGLDIFTMLKNATTLSFNYLPFRKYASPVKLQLKSELDEEIPFKIELTSESSKYYKMVPFSGILKKNVPTIVELEIYSKSKMIVSDWGELEPNFRLNVTYEYKDKEITIISGAADYWPEIY